MVVSTRGAVAYAVVLGSCCVHGLLVRIASWAAGSPDWEVTVRLVTRVLLLLVTASCLRLMRLLRQLHGNATNLALQLKRRPQVKGEEAKQLSSQAQLVQAAEPTSESGKLAEATFSADEIASAFRLLCAPGRPDWRVVSNDGQLEMLVALGFPWLLSKTASSAPLSVGYSRDGDRVNATPSLGGVLKVAPQSWTVGRASCVMDFLLGKFYIRSLLTIVDGFPRILDKAYSSDAERAAAGPPRWAIMASISVSSDGAVETFTQKMQYDVRLPKPARGGFDLVLRRPAP